MHAIGPRINVFSTHVVSMLVVLVAIGSSVSYMQLQSASPDVDLRISELNFLYVYGRVFPPPSINKLYSSSLTCCKLLLSFSDSRQYQREQCDQAYIKFDLKAGKYTDLSFSPRTNFIFLHFFSSANMNDSCREIHSEQQTSPRCGRGI